MQAHAPATLARVSQQLVDVSIVIPFYGRCLKHLQQAIASIALDNGRVEIVVVDDFSQAQPTINDFIIHHSAILKIVRLNSNLGPGSARNEGLRYATGAFTAFLDADDFFAPGYLDSSIEELRSRDDVGLFSHPSEYVTINGERLGGRAASPEGFYSAGDLVSNRFHLQATVGRSAVIRSISFSSNRRAEDHEYFYRICDSGLPLYCSHLTLIRHRCGATESITRSNVAADLSDRLSVIRGLATNEASLDAYQQTLVGQRALGLLYLSLLEGDQQLGAEVISVLSDKDAQFVLTPPANAKAAQDLADFFAQKQFGRHLLYSSNIDNIATVAIGIIRAANDCYRAAHWMIIESLILTNLGRLACVTLQSFVEAALRSCSVESLHDPDSPSRCLDARRPFSPFQVWTNNPDKNSIETCEISQSDLFAVILRNRLVRRGTSYLFNSMVARSLLLSHYAHSDELAASGWNTHD